MAFSSCPQANASLCNTFAVLIPIIQQPAKQHSIVIRFRMAKANPFVWWWHDVKHGNLFVYYLLVCLYHKIVWFCWLVFIALNWCFVCFFLLLRLHFRLYFHFIWYIKSSILNSMFTIRNSIEKNAMSPNRQSSGDGMRNTGGQKATFIHSFFIVY